MLGDIPPHIGSKLGKKSPEVPETLEQNDSEQNQESSHLDAKKPIIEKSESVSPENEDQDEEKAISKRIKKRSAKRIRKVDTQESTANVPEMVITPHPKTSSMKEEEKVSPTQAQSSHESEIENSPRSSQIATETDLNNPSSEPQEVDKFEVNLEIPKSKLHNIIDQRDMTVNKSNSDKEEKDIPKASTPKKAKPATKRVKKKPLPESTSSSVVDSSTKERRDFLDNLRKDTSNYLDKLKREREARSEEMKRFRENLREELASQRASIRNNEAERQKRTNK
ncbi:MAG: hypothetical protein RIC03_13565 [Cyclobacteriaceae bacterium]